MHPASEEVQEALGVPWVGAFTSLSRTMQTAGQQGRALPASEYGKVFSQDLLGQNCSIWQLPGGGAVRPWAPAILWEAPRPALWVQSTVSVGSWPQRPALERWVS